MSRSKKMDMYREGGESGGKWIKGAIGKPGALHRSLHVPKGRKIPASKLNSALHSRNALTRKRANLAKTLESFHH
jgi:hypothetical protein